MGINYSFQAAKVEHHYWVQGKDGSKGAESQMGWDVKQNVATA
jgi:type VI secretion system secreted protein Hcp